MKIGSLFSGAGGLDMAVEDIFGGNVVWHCEQDKAASKVLAHRWPGVPNLGDITTVDWTAVEPVDVLCGGFPCTDVSAAGKRAGIAEGTRSGLWSEMAVAIGVLRPSIVIIENVRGLLSARAHRNVEFADTTLGDQSERHVLRAAGAVLGDLADLGYDAQWATVAAGDVGAPHRRERVFIVASSADASGDGRGGCTECNLKPTARLAAPRRDDSDRRVLADGRCERCTDTPDAKSNRRHEGRPEPARIVGGFDAAIGGDGPVDVPLLPTPCVVDRLATGEMTLDEGDESRRLQKENGVGSFGPRGDSLGAAILRVKHGVINERPDYSTTKARSDGPVDLPPTPTSRDHKGRNQRDDETCLPVTLLPTPGAKDGSGGCVKGTLGGKRPSGASRTISLSTAVHHELLPTPNASDGTGGGQHPDKREGPSRQLIDYVLLCSPAASDGAGGKTSRSGERIDEPLLGGQAREMATAWGKYEPAIRRWESLTRLAPAPTEPNKNGNPRLAATFSEWLMGWPASHVTDPAIGISRNDQLRIVGNGVCPQQAMAALEYLLAVNTHTHTGAC